MKQVKLFTLDLDRIAEAASACTSTPGFAARPRKASSMKSKVRGALNRVMARLTPLEARAEIKHRKLGDIIEVQLTLHDFPTGWVWFGTEISCAIAAEMLAAAYRQYDAGLAASFAATADEICSTMFYALSHPQRSDAA